MLYQNQLDMDVAPQMQQDQSSYLRVILITVFLGLLGFGLASLSNYEKVRKNWNKYRCQPQYMALAPLYGFDRDENIAYCLQNVMQSEAAGILNPVYKVIGGLIGVLATLLNNTNSLRLQLATMVGGVAKIVQQFTDRFSQFMFAFQNLGIRMKALMGRVYGTLFSFIYMGTSGITAVMNLSDNSLVRFLTTFCFQPSTPIYVRNRGIIPICDVQIGDILAHGGRVTARFAFSAKGQQMCRLGYVRVSTNHFVRDPAGKWIMAGEHPDAQHDKDYEFGPERPLICLNTSDHQISLGGYMFSDYDETEEGDKEAAVFVEKSLNGYNANPSTTTFKEYGALVHPHTLMEVGKYANSICAGEQLSNGATVLGMIDKEISEATRLPNNTIVSPSTLVWNADKNMYERAADITGALKITYDVPQIFRGFIVNPHSTIITDSGLYLRDYLEVCSPDTENAYAASLRAQIGIKA